MFMVSEVLQQWKSWCWFYLYGFLFFLLVSSRVRSEQSLVRWATPQLHDIDALAKMVDPALNGMYPAKSLSRFADIIALCVQVNYLRNDHWPIALSIVSLLLSYTFFHFHRNLYITTQKPIVWLFFHEKMIITRYLVSLSFSRNPNFGHQCLRLCKHWYD